MDGYYKRLYQSPPGGIERIQCFIHVFLRTLATVGPQEIGISDDSSVISLSTRGSQQALLL